MHDPFKIDLPTCVSFSGGRSSGYMLWRTLQANGGLPADAVVAFANTGKEMTQTLDFVHACAVHWGIPIHWLEYEWNEDPELRWREVTYETASREGKPFEALINQNANRTGAAFLPNPVKRICTVQLKIMPSERFMRSLGHDEWDSMIGIRADERHRVAKIRADPSGQRKGVTRTMPLADAGVSKFDVGEFWRNQDFDLNLPNMNGVTMHGNCDLCFLKPLQQIVSLIREEPARAVWWARMEAEAQSLGASRLDGARFRKDRPGYAALAQYAKEQRDMFDQDEEAIPCFCGD